MRHPPVIERSVLITGCSSGIGREAAMRLRTRGWRVFATARKPADLDALRAAGFEAIELDLTSDESVARAFEQTLQAAGGRLGALVNNAGYGQPGAMEDLTRDALRRQFEANFFGPLDLTRRCIPVFRRQGYGRIVNVSSVVGRLALPFLGAYSASKFALAAASAAMRMELRGSGVAVSLVEPGPIETSFSDNAMAAGQAHMRPGISVFDRLYRDQIRQMETGAYRQSPFRRPPEAVATRIIHALESPRPRRRYRITLLAHLGAFMARFAPDGLLDFALAGRYPAGR
jgi:NAD(P)-dependent dehydrogenase (short-subunit alcohol dehydrogenase family)